MISPTLTSAPIPDALEVLGFESFQTKNKTNPTNGIQNPKSPQPKPPLSEVCKFLPVATPQLGQTIAFSSNQ